MLTLHHGKHHKAYVDGANKTLDRLAEAREKSDYDNLVGLEKALAFNLSGHVLHTLFWQNLSPDWWRQARPATSPPRSTSTSARSTRSKRR